MSNTSSAPGRPDYLKQLDKNTDLKEAWKEILDARVNHRTVWVFPNASTAKSGSSVLPENKIKLFSVPWLRFLQPHDLYSMYTTF